MYFETEVSAMCGSLHPGKREPDHASLVGILFSDRFMGTIQSVNLNYEVLNDLTPKLSPEVLLQVELSYLVHSS